VEPAQRYRPADLAAAAGISTQQVRNDEAAGVLPFVGRTASGYRVYTEHHLRALLTYRALARAHGPATARDIMRSVHRSDVAGALEMIDVGHSQLQEQRQQLRATQRALDAVAGDDIADVRDDDDMLIGEVADALGIRASALRSWDAAGLVRPGRTPRYEYRTYSPTDVRDARVTAQLRLSGYGLDQIREVLQAWRVTGGAQAIRAASANREDALAHRSRSMLAAAAALSGFLDADR
jgi:DNA-binding transcriptional MerR regulator